MTRYHIPRSRDPIEKQCADANSQLSKQTLGERSRQGLSLALLAFRGLIWRKGGEPIWASAPPTQICQSMPLREDVRATPRLRVQTSSLLTPSVIISLEKCKPLQKLGVCKKTQDGGRFRQCGRGVSAPQLWWVVRGSSSFKPVPTAGSPVCQSVAFTLLRFLHLF